MKKEEYRLRLVTGGYIPLPLHGKAPAPPAWQNYREITPAMIQMWNTAWSGAINTGVLTRYVPTFDIDILNPEAAQAVEEMVREFYEEKGRLILRIGKAPKRAFLFRTDKPFKKLSITFAGTPDKLEFLCDGQQVVVDGIHPETQKPYAWFGGTPEEIARRELPEIGVAEAQELIERAAVILEGFGFKRVGKAGKASNGASTSGAGDWNYLVDRIKAGESLHDNLLFLSAKMVGAGMMGGAVVNFLRSLMEDLPRDERWQERYDDIPRAVAGAEEKYSQAPSPGVTFSFERGKGPNQEQTEPEEPEEPPVVTASLADLPGADRSWLEPQGLLGEMTEYILRTSRKPNRPLAVAGAIATLSALCGRHVFSPTRAALNLYLICVAETGTGKDWPLDAPSCLLRAAGRASLYQSGKAFSQSGVEQLIGDYPAVLATVDEIGGALIAPMMKAREGSHAATMKEVFNQLWSRFHGKSDFIPTPKVRQKGSEIAQPIKNPSLTLFGMSTEEALWGAMSEVSIHDGFLNRLLYIVGAPRGKSQNVSDEDLVVPRTVAAQMKAIIPKLQASGDVPPERDIQAATSVFSRGASREALDSVSVILTWASEETAARAAALEEEILEIMDNSATDDKRMMGRVYEHVVRLASLHAVGREGRRAEVNGDDLDWGIAVTCQSAIGMIAGVKARLSVTANQTIAKDVLRVLADVGKELPAWQLRKRLGHKYKKQDLDHVLEDLVGTREVIRRQGKVGPRVSKKAEWFSLPE